MKNVLFLSSWYPSRVHTTLGNFVRYHALAASKYNSINVLYIVADDNVKDYEIKYFQDHELKTTIVYFKRGIFKYLNYFVAFIKGFHFVKEKNKLKFDIVHMNIMHPGIWQALYLKWRYKIPYVVSENWHGFQDLAKYNLSFLEMKLIKIGIRFSSVISPVSKQLKNCMINANYQAKYQIIPNVVDTDKFHIGELDTNKNNFTFLHVSTLDDSIKNVSGIIDAFEKIKHKNMVLKIIGDGPVDWIIKKVSTLKTKNTVVVESEKTHDQIAKEMQKADVFVLFSNIENLPLVLIESISSGTPFIATKVGGIPELFNNELGRLVDAGSIDQLLSEMNFMVENPDFFNPSRIRSFAIKNYSNEEVGKKFNDLYIENCN
ncbi:MAG: N-acetyl-alpha-D-glucosaminyl L-malate synthase [Crocinitomicaceae bacterium]|nr:MAG: N-acetyl-alpha-D-glucosaminyl L-malate synthase [Crocinitomicaceae bacterium]